MRYGVLGPLSVRNAAGEPVAVPEVKVRALLVNLLLHRGVPVPADRLVHDLWGEHPPGRPLNTLQTKVSQLRRVLGPGRVLHGAGGYRLEAAPEDVDSDRFEDLVERAAAASGAAARSALASRALDLWRGEPFPELSDVPASGAEAARLDELRVSAMEIRAGAYLDLGESCCAAADTGDLLSEHPLREHARALHMLALYREGRQGEALASYEQARARLDEDLGIDPGPRLADLHTAVLRQDPALDGGRSGPVSDGSGPRGGAGADPGSGTRRRLPLPATPMVGRDRDLDRLLRVWDGPGKARPGLVTVTGPGGVGKTRLALAAARVLAGEDTCETPPVRGPLDGVHLVELADAERDASAADLASVVLACLPEREVHAGGGATGGLGAALDGRDTVLVLDNGEHVAGAVAELLTTLASEGVPARAIVTSQEILDVPGERVIALEPLHTPDTGETGTATTEAVLGSDAGRLFVERARDADPAFTLTDDNAAVVAEICRRLDGLPLALELVAARIRALGVERILAGLDRGFSLPVGEARGRPRRQRNLRAMAEWSWGLLTKAEQVVLRRLCAFPDGLTLETARSVVGGADVPSGEVDAVLVRLVDRSLLLRDGGGYRVPGVVAAYGRERARATAPAPGERCSSAR